MAKTHKQRVYDELNVIVDKHPNMRVSDLITTLESFAEGLFRALPPPKEGRKCVERTARYRLA